MTKSRMFKIKPSHMKILKNGNWISWPFGEINANVLKKHELGQTKTIQGIVIFELTGGLTANNTYWHWSFDKGFTAGEHANGSSCK